MLDQSNSSPLWLALATTIGLMVCGCGTTRSSDTTRTATEQLLVSDAIDRAVSDLNVARLNGQEVYFEDRYLTNAVDRHYLVSSIRQHLLANGCRLKDDKKKAAFIVEARAGAVGTNRHDLLFGIPSMNLPQIFPLQGIPAAIPEVPFAKRRDQRGVAKVALFAYHRETGTPVWQSGLAQQESSLNDVWLLGAGPFQHGTIQKGPAFAQDYLGAPEEDGIGRPYDGKTIGLAREAVFATPQQIVERSQPKPKVPTDSKVELADHQAPVEPEKPSEPAPFQSQ